MRANKLFGVDVSVWQGTIDWAMARADGVDFAMIKATQGLTEQANSNLYLFTDSYFIANMIKAVYTGVKCGVYHYLTATNVSEAQIEADYFINSIESYRRSITLYAAVDVESKHLPKDKNLLTEIVHVFCGYVKSKGYEPIVYTNPDFLRYRLNDISKWKLWLALWRDNTNVPSGYGDMKIWQWGKSKVNGINGKVDSNFGFYALDEIEGGTDTMTDEQFKGYIERYEAEKAKRYYR
jgi:lysozyme